MPRWGAQVGPVKRTFSCKMSEYTIIIHPAEEGGFWVEVPMLPGCFSQGESIEEVMSNASEAIDLHIEC